MGGGHVSSSDHDTTNTLSVTMSDFPSISYDPDRHVDEQLPTGSLVEWDMDPEVELYWRALQADPSDRMLVIQTDNEWNPDGKPDGSYPACKILQGGKLRWAAAMYLRRVE